MYVYRVIAETSNECLPEPYFDKAKAIEAANALKEKAKGKLEFKVCSLVPVYSTKEETKQKDIEF